MTTVRIPPVLRAETGGRRDVEVAGDTVRKTLEALLAAFPALEGRVLEQGHLQPFVNLYLNGTDVQALDGLDTAVDSGSTLLLLPAMAGGSGDSAVLVGTQWSLQIGGFELPRSAPDGVLILDVWKRDLSL